MTEPCLHERKYALVLEQLDEARNACDRYREALETIYAVHRHPGMATRMHDIADKALFPLTAAEMRAELGLEDEATP